VRGEGGVSGVLVKGKEGVEGEARCSEEGREEKEDEDVDEGKMGDGRTRLNRNHETLRLLMNVVPDLPSFTRAGIDDLFDLLPASEGGSVTEGG
jgi:hypothetical protein